MHNSFAVVVALGVAVSLVACAGQSMEDGDGEHLGQGTEALTNVCPPVGSVLGIDVASYQHPNGAAIDWAKVATQRQFVYVKATQDTGYANPNYAGDVTGARTAGLIAGSYAVVAPQSKTGASGAAQAQFFLAHSSLKPGDLPPLLDVEPFAEYGSVLPELATITGWLDTVEKAIGRKPTIYIRPDLIARLGTPPSLAAYAMNIANYSTCPGFPDCYPVERLTFWQYTDNASVPGIAAAVDGIRFYGDLTALRAFAAGGAHAAGVLDSVTCTSIAGWAWDPSDRTKSTSVKLSFDGALGTAGATAVSYPAADERPDLVKAIGASAHGFAITPPRSLFDGKSHTVDAYAVSLTAGGVGDRLTSPQQKLNCPALPLPGGTVKRWITSRAVFAGWKLDAFTDIAPETDAALAAVTKGADIENKPACVIADDGAPEVWILDQGKRRHVVNPASLAAWRLVPTKLAAAELKAHPQGPSWPATPALVKGDAPEVYLLDVDIGSPIAPAPAPGATPDDRPAAGPDAAEDAGGGGCAVGGRGGVGGSGDATWIVALGAVLAARGRRQRRAAVLVAGSLLALLALLAMPRVAAAAVTHPFTGVTEVTHADRVLVIADLCAPGVSIRATKYAEREATPQQWATKAGVNADVAINADFFDFPGWTYVIGRARGAGEEWPAGQQNKENRSYWEFGPAVARLVEPGSTAPGAGVTEIVGAHNVLIRNGKSLAPNFDGDGVITTSHRRTAIGIDAARAHVYLFASNASLDGTQVVASVVQMAAESGAPTLDFLTNEDGGGSSQMYIRGQGQVIDSGRQVNNHLGIFARGAGASPTCPDHAPRGALDAAACTTIDGWAQDQDAPTQSVDVQLYFDKPSGAAGAAGAITAVADIDRPDLAAAIGSTKHGFAADAPYGLFDGKPHPVFAYAVDSKGGANPLLGQKQLTCSASAPASIRRHVSSPAVLAAWKLALFTDAMPLTDAVIDAFGPGTDLAATPVLVRADDKSPEVWLVDGPYRRHVTDPRSAAAWHFDLAKVVTKPAAEVDALLRGPDVRARPLLTRASTGAVYVLDDPGALPPGATVGPDGGVIVAPGSAGGDGASTPGSEDGAGGCAVSAGAVDGAASVVGAFALGLLALAWWSKRCR